MTWHAQLWGAHRIIAYEQNRTERSGLWRGLFLRVLLALNIPMFINVNLMGRCSAIMRCIEMGLSPAFCAVLLWTVVAGPVFIAASSDPTVNFTLVLMVAFTLTNVANRQYLNVRPTPNLPIQSMRELSRPYLRLGPRC